MRANFVSIVNRIVYPPHALTRILPSSGNIIQDVSKKESKIIVILSKILSRITNNEVMRFLKEIVSK